MKKIIFRFGKALLLILGFTVVLLFAVVVFFTIAAIFREKDTIEAAPTAGRFLDTSMGKFYVQEAGKDTDPAVILIHGSFAWSGTWKDTLAVLGNTGFHAIAIDLPPFGYSSRPIDASYTSSDQAARIISILDTMRISKAIFVGHSFGAAATVNAVMTHPERVTKLILVDAAISLEPYIPRGGVTSFIMDHRLLRNPLLATTATNPLLSKKILSSFIYKPYGMRDQILHIYQAPLSRRGSTDALGEWLEVFMHPPYSIENDSNQYKNIKAPTFLIWGDKDTITPLAQGEHLHSLIPESHLVVLPEVGHIPQIEDPDQFNAAILKTLQN